MVESILSDESLPVSESAARLRLIVVRADISLSEREEALAHGLNLDLSQFTELASDVHLPVSLARKLFDSILNFNSRRDLQVRVCMMLINHDDSALRDDAAMQLGFYIGLEEWAKQPGVLKQEAQAFLEDWGKRPKPAPDLAHAADEPARTPDTSQTNSQFENFSDRRDK